MDENTSIGPDGVPRCAWVGDDQQYRDYHDQEWGRTLRGDQPLFEKMSLEGFQAGLSWITILRKRENFRTAFAQFDASTVATFDEAKVLELLSDAGIVRNRKKIEAVISNAQLLQSMEHGEFDELMWSFAPRDHQRPVTLAEVPAQTAESKALSKELIRRGFRFVGPTTMYALMQSVGMVDDHVQGCRFAVFS